MNNSYKSLASVYDSLMYDIDYDAWADYLAGLLKKHARENARVLEAACGTGNLSLRLSKRGFDIAATDLSEEMLSVAADKARKAGSSIPFARQDMRELSSAPKHAVIACCDGVNYLTDDDALRDFFRAAYNCLKKSGVLLFDISSHHKLSNILGNDFFYEDGPFTTYFWKNKFDPEKETVQMQLTFFLREGEIYRRSDETHLQKAHRAEHLLALLKECGFAEAHAYSFLTEDPCTETDERIQFVAIKKKETR